MLLFSWREESKSRVAFPSSFCSMIHSSLWSSHSIGFDSKFMEFVLPLSWDCHSLLHTQWAMIANFLSYFSFLSSSHDQSSSIPSLSFIAKNRQKLRREAKRCRPLHSIDLILITVMVIIKGGATGDVAPYRSLQFPGCPHDSAAPGHHHGIGK